MSKTSKEKREKKRKNISKGNKQPKAKPGKVIVPKNPTKPVHWDEIVDMKKSAAEVLAINLVTLRDFDADYEGIVKPTDVGFFTKCHADYLRLYKDVATTMDNLSNILMELRSKLNPEEGSDNISEGEVANEQ